jgi:hypothetical protein
MSALLEHPTTASVSASASLTLGAPEEFGAVDPLIEEPMDLDRDGEFLRSVPQAPEDEYPAGSGPYGF